MNNANSRILFKELCKKMIDRAVRRGRVVQFSWTFFCDLDDVSKRIDFERGMHNQNIWYVYKVSNWRKAFD